MRNDLLILILIAVVVLMIACAPAKSTQKTDAMEGMQHGAAMKAHAGNYKSVDAHLYTIKFNQPAAQTGQEATLEFKITEKDSQKPITELEIVHEKPMHVVLVRNDLKHFDHIHPILKDGAWVVGYTFSAAGEYRIWIDFTKDMMQHVVDFDLSVSGKQEAEEQDKLYGLQVKFITHEKIQPNTNVKLDFVVTDSAGKPIPITEKFLAANAHLITIDESLKEFEHAHDMNFDNDNVLSFIQSFSESGKYKAWVQFYFDGKVRTAPFDFSVSEDMTSQHNMETMGQG